MTNERFRIGVLVSGSGTNLQAILDTVHERDGIEVVGVVSNVANATALKRAQQADIETAVFDDSDYESRVARDTAMRVWLEQRRVDLVVLAGYMHLVDRALLRAFRNRVINVHPSLLPAFPGATPIEDQVAAGTTDGGVTVHFVDEGVDTGPIILQEPVKLSYTRGREEILSLLHETEHKLLPRAIRLIAAGAVSIDPDNPRNVIVDEGALSVHE